MADLTERGSIGRLVQKQVRQQGADDFTCSFPAVRGTMLPSSICASVELQPPLRLGLQDAIFNPRQQLMVHRPRDEGQNALPNHLSSPPADCCPKIVA